ncbi:N-acetyl-gamma-glutamyl-phosphate reductase [Oceanicella actignis]|uniref:N-acetyl-gamma-glutamyl-phosphate reductase n=1 Tax=Oceanicella actignis TaxID=1189325 RepID=A0A1M7S2K8_9RHOB|nr:N-acetyl-gamma-glutamyl-phosphate reductase [Oceanicella actignis]TYO90183.1 N-acetyl-gamma-glutamyl-phosphate reductase [Oceanicella actignis]SES90140.1 N-acetyl-gamma-glutamyl-phosphate reductase [Oceanicella actignis]SHN52731.1 N-acetyl-gamma-glutamyl-phosphate reductase [Oceanicella actignis]
MKKAEVAILGASGYTGAELVRLLVTHPGMRIAALSADRKAGMSMGEVFPHLGHLDLPPLQRVEDIDFSGIELVFVALPHGTTQEVIAALPRHVKIVDLSADFRLRDPEDYARWYGHPHLAPELQKEAVYGLPEFYREQLRACRLAAGTGCFVATGLLPLVPLLEAGVIAREDIVIDAKTGITGAGRGASERKLFSEVTEGVDAYNIARHRHTAEFDQELSRAAGAPVRVTFTPHLLPMNRGILATIYVKGDAREIHRVLDERHRPEPFVHVLPLGAEAPQTRHVRGSNLCRIGVTADRIEGRAIIVSVLDNLVKGASGQAVQAANLMLGLPETTGLEAAPLFP